MHAGLNAGLAAGLNETQNEREVREAEELHKAMHREEEMVHKAEAREAEKTPSHLRLRKDDLIRMDLLRTSRDTSPVATVMRLDLLRRTVLPKLLTQPTQWVVLAVYATTAICSRVGVEFGDINDANFAGAGTM